MLFLTVKAYVCVFYVYIIITIAMATLLWNFFAVIVCVSGRYTTPSDVFLAVGITVGYFSVSLSWRLLLWRMKVYKLINYICKNGIL
jgi:hypothetical protein